MSEEIFDTAGDKEAEAILREDINSIMDAEKKASNGKKKNGKKKKKKVQGKQRIFIIVLLIIFVVMIIGSLIYLRSDYHRQKLLNDQYSDMAKQTTEDVELSEAMKEKISYYKETYGIEVPKKAIDFDKMQEKYNKDIYAWVYVPGTQVDHPVLQHPSDDTYYLDYNLDGTKGYPGCAFTQKINNKDFNDKMTVIYGHNMGKIKGTMFSTLHNYESEDFFKKNHYIYIYLPDDVLVYDIFAAYGGSNEHIMYSHNWDDEKEVREYIGNVLAGNFPDPCVVNSAMEYTKDDKFLTLSTCLNGERHIEERYLVQAKLLK